VATVVQNAFNGGVAFTSPFATLIGLATASVPAALTQVSGELGAGAGNVGITPHAALQLQAFRKPTYTESDQSGLAGFALRYGATTTTDVRSELGARFDAAAWRALTASVANLSADAFSVTGALPTRDAALVTAGAELALSNGVSLRGKFDGTFSHQGNVYAGTGSIAYHW
jgi:uncharacterized protein with beta-barrel porin domain